MVLCTQSSLPPCKKRPPSSHVHFVRGLLGMSVVISRNAGWIPASPIRRSGDEIWIVESKDRCQTTIQASYWVFITNSPYVQEIATNERGDRLCWHATASCFARHLSGLSSCKLDILFLPLITVSLVHSIFLLFSLCRVQCQLAPIHCCFPPGRGLKL